MPPYQGFCGASYTSQSPIARIERCVNWYPERIEVTGEFALYPTPGVSELVQSTQVGGRGGCVAQGRAFVVIGAQFAELNSDFTLTIKGIVVDDGKPAYVTTNGDAVSEIMIAAGGKGYLYNMLTDAFTNPVDNVHFMGMVDTFFVALDADTSTFKMSNSYAGGTWDGTNILQRGDAADGWISMLVVEPEIWLFGTNTGSVLFDNGASPFPFALRQGLIIPQGTCARYSPAVLDGNPVWLGGSTAGDRIVYGAQGYSAARISTHAMEWAMSQYARVDDAIGYTYQDQGHSFYVLNFPSANATWVYDAVTGLWHERPGWNPDHLQEEAWRAAFHLHAFNTHIFGDRTSGKLYRGNVTLGLDFGGRALRRMRRGPGLRKELQRLFIKNWQLDVETGLGIPSGQGSDPMVMFRYSWNAGKTWSNERAKSAGKEGDFGRRVIFNRLGSGAHFVPEVSVTDPIPWRLSGAAFNVPVHEAA